MKVAQVLSSKSTGVLHSVSPESTVLEALKLMAHYNIGAVLVMTDDQLIGIFTERDYARKGILAGRIAQETLISEVMTQSVITVQPTDQLEACMQLMSDRHIRHLPAVDKGRVVGMISITDVITALLHDQKHRVAALEHYISGGPA